jgi:hypothetical protein
MGKYISQMTVGELREELSQHGLSRDDLRGIRKPDLKLMLKSSRKGEPNTNCKIVDDGVIVSNEDTSKKEDVIKSHPDQNSVEWTQYVLGLFNNDELENQNPKVDGLRRIASMLIGPIVEEGSELVSPPSLDNGQRACVKAWVIFYHKKLGRTIRFEGLADVCSDNCDETFARFPTSTAETRARGRCFRMALQLRKVIAAEEANFELPENGNDKDVVIQVGQISVIQLMADRLNVSIPKLLNHLDLNKSDLQSLTKVEGLIVVKHLNSIQQTGHIPESIAR